MASQKTPWRLLVALMALAAMMQIACATYVTSNASASANGDTYTFGNWTRYTVKIELNCTDGDSSCNMTAYCIDTSNDCDPTASGTIYDSALSISSEGIHYLRFASNDSDGNWGAVVSKRVKIDSVDPEISIEQDAGSSWACPDTISVETSDALSGIARTRWIAQTSSLCDSDKDDALDAGTVGEEMNATSESEYMGKYICFRTEDEAGNYAYAISSKISYLDCTAPSVEAGADKTTSTGFTQTATVSESTSGIQYYYWSQVSGPGTVTFASPYSKDTSINANADGTYVLRLTVTDKAGNAGNDTFTLVWDTTNPTIVISEPGSSQARTKTLAASASDATLTMAITTGTTCSSALSFGTYQAMTFNSEEDNGKRICYRAIDTTGNAAYALSEPISGIETGAPTLTLRGAASVQVEVHGTYTDARASASDAHDGDLTDSIETDNPLNTGVVGTYTITYRVSDAAGNAASPISRTVQVVDTTKPILTLMGNTSLTIQKGANYSDAGASASDNYDGDLSAKIVRTGTVDTNQSGSYTLSYAVSDSAGNAAEPVRRTVQVQDNLLDGLLSLALGLLALALIGGLVGGAYLLLKRQHRHGGL